MDIQVASFLKTRWGLEWIRFLRSPITFTIASEFVRNVGIDLESLSCKGFAVVKHDGVGSLSGLIAGTIAAMQRKNYGLYQVQYITSTNPTGIAFLKDYLVKRVSCLGGEPVDISGVNCDGELFEIVTMVKGYPLQFEKPLCIVAHDEIQQKNKSSTLIDTNKYIVPSDTDAYAVIDMEPEVLLSFLRSSKVNGHDSDVILLLYLNEKYDWSSNWREIKSTINLEFSSRSITICTTENTAASIVSLPFDGMNLVTLASQLSKEIGSSILIHCNTAVVLADHGKHALINLRKHPSKEEIARCLAGVFVSTVANEYVMRLDGPEYLHANLLEQLVLGYSWAKTNESIEDFPTEEELLKRLRLANSSPYRELNHYSILREEDLDSSFETRSYINLKRLEQVYHTSSGNNEVNKKLYRYVQSNNDLVISAAVDRLQQIDGLSHLPRPNEERVVFLDLDLTLFDYSSAREEGAKKALKELPLEISISEAIEIYKSIIDRWAALELLGFPNLRRIWNDKIVYYLIYLLASKNFLYRSKEIFELLTEIERKDNDSSLARALIEKSDTGQDFFEALELAKADVQLQQSIRRAYLHFEKATEQLRPFNETRDILSTLSKIEGYHIFVVTEGDSKIQWEKIEKLGLQDLVSPTSLIVTDELSNQPFLCNSIAQTENHTKLLLNKTGSIERVRLEKENIRFCQNLYKYFHLKKDGHFYRHALHIAARNILGQRNEKVFDNVSATMWDQMRPIKVATVGDRYINDIFPLMQLLGPNNLLSIHLLYGKYIDEKVPNDSPNPDFTATRLIKARNILLQDKSWSTKGPIKRPRHLGIDLTEDEIISVLIGLAMTPSIASISEALLEDRGFSERKIEKLRQRVTKELTVRESSFPLRSRIEQILHFID